MALVGVACVLLGVGLVGALPDGHLVRAAAHPGWRGSGEGGLGLDGDLSLKWEWGLV